MKTFYLVGFLIAIILCPLTIYLTVINVMEADWDDVALNIFTLTMWSLTFWMTVPYIYHILKGDRPDDGGP